MVMFDKWGAWKHDSPSWPGVPGCFCNDPDPFPVPTRGHCCSHTQSDPSRQIWCPVTHILGNVMASFVTHFTKYDERNFDCGKEWIVPMSVVCFVLSGCFILSYYSFYQYKWGPAVCVIYLSVEYYAGCL